MNERCVKKSEGVDERCQKTSIIGCETCNNGIVVVQRNCVDEDDKISNCQYIHSQHDHETNTEINTCLLCDDNFVTSENGASCSENSKTEVEYIRNNVNYDCIDGYFLNDNMECEQCKEGTVVCNYVEKTIQAITCQSEKYLDDETNTCKNDSLCQTYKDSTCITCSESGDFINEGHCVECDIPNCEKCLKGKCEKCSQGYLLSDESTCKSESEMNCLTSVNGQCLECFEGYSLGSNVQNDYQHCILNPIENCGYVYQTGEGELKCQSCSSGYYLENNECLVKEDETMKRSTNENCLEKTEKGCVRCHDGYFLRDYECYECENGCKTCVDETYCLTCPNGTFINNKNECQEQTEEIKERCLTPFPDNSGCVVCKDGYYMEKKTCLNCQEGCHVCFNNKECVECTDKYFMIEGESKICKPQSELTNCKNTTNRV